MALREFTGGAKRTTLASELTSGAFTMQVVDATGYPTGTTGPFALALDQGQAAEEKVLCSTRSGNTITIVTRGYDGTAASTHPAGSTVDHVVTAIDLAEANAHVNDASKHQVVDTSTFVTLTGTQTVTNKTLGSGTVFPSTVVDTTTAQTLTNKTLGSGTVLPATVVDTTTDQTLTNKTLAASTVFPTTVVSTAGGSTITASNPAVVPLVVKGASGQTVNLLEARNSSGSVLAAVRGDGVLLVVLNESGVGLLGTREIQVGSANSAGTGFRIVRVAN